MKETKDQFSRTELILGKDGMEKLFDAKVAVFGIGGVGGYAVEALARSGIGRIDLYDNDKICLTNLNRQLHATTKNIGEYKVDAARERILDINPDAIVNTYKIFYVPDTSEQVDLTQYDYVVDAIDTVSGKIELAVKTYEGGIPVISSMGAGNKMEASLFEIADIYATSVCPLAKVMRHELRKRGIPKLKVVYSKEPVIAPIKNTTPDYGQYCAFPPGTEENQARRRQPPGSTAFVPPVVGMIIAGEVVKELTSPTIQCLPCRSR